MCRAPGNYAVVVSTLAVGVFGNVAAFALINAVVLRELPYTNPERLVVIWEDNSRRGIGLTPTSLPNFEDLKASATSFEDIGVFTDVALNLTAGLRSERVRGLQASATLLGLTGIPALHGRTLQRFDDEATSPNVVVLGHGLWQQSFGADPAAIGQTILLSDVAYTVVGVMPPGFQLPPGFSSTVASAELIIRPPDLWMPLKPATQPPLRGQRYLFALGRVRADRSLDQARSELQTIAARLAAQYPETNRELQLTLVPLRAQVMGSLGAALPMFVLVAALLFAIACVNAVSVSAAAAVTRRHQNAVRMALGATPADLYRQLLSDGVAVSVAAGVLGVTAAYGFLEVLASSGGGLASGLSQVTIDGAVLLFATALSLGIGFGVAAVPVVGTPRGGLTGWLTAEGSRLAGSRRAQVMRRTVVVAQVALAVVVVTAAGQLVSGFLRLSQVNPGLDPEHVVTFAFTLPESTYRERHLKTSYQRAVLDVVEAVSGVRSAATVDFVPFGEHRAIMNLTVEGVTPQTTLERPRALWRSVSPGYFRALAIPLLDGRALDESDDADATPVAVVNTAFAQRYWPGTSPIGKRVKRGRAAGTLGWMTVVGLTGEVRGTGLAVPPQPEILVPYGQQSITDTFTLIARTDAPPEPFIGAIRQRAGQVDPQVPLSSVRSMDALVADSIGRPRLYAGLLTVFAVLALVLALSGTYGLSAAIVSTRGRELRLRMCLGATPHLVAGLVLRQAMPLVLAGIVAGLVGSVFAARAMSGVFVGVDALEWPPYLASSAMLLATGLLANLAPLRRAVRISTTGALSDHDAVRV